MAKEKRGAILKKAAIVGKMIGKGKNSNGEDFDDDEAHMEADGENGEIQRSKQRRLSAKFDLAGLESVDNG